MSYLVVAVSIFMLFCVTCQYILIFEPLGFIDNIYGQIYILIYLILFYMLCYSYWKAITTPPGFAPLDWIPEGVSRKELDDILEYHQHQQQRDQLLQTKYYTINRSSNNNNNNNLNNDNSGGDSNTQQQQQNNSNDVYLPIPNNYHQHINRYCTKCNIFKPPRTHHCKQCKRCILKMDHHCPWIGNCVGHYNHKSFVLFLFYVVVMGTLSVLLLIFSGFYILNNSLNYEGDTNNGPIEQLKFSVPSAAIMVLFIINLAFLIPVLLGVSGLFYFQLGFVMLNLTTIERREKKSEYKSAKRSGLQDKYKWRYDRGRKHNFREVFGDGLSEWVCPVGIPRGDGINWRANTSGVSITTNENNSNGSTFMVGSVEHV